MSYLKIGETEGVRIGTGGGKSLDKGVPYITVSTHGSKRSNSGGTDKRTSWFKRYQQNNTRRANKLSRQG